MIEDIREIFQTLLVPQLEGIRGDIQSMCHRVTHERNLNSRAAPAYRRPVRNARKYGAIVVSDRNIPVVKLIPITEETPTNRFEKWGIKGINPVVV